MENKPDLGDRAAEAGAEIVGKLLELGGRTAEGLFSSPWTGVPTALLVLAQIDPSGKLTQQFLSNLGTFLTAVGSMLGNALQQGLAGIGKAIVPPPFQPFTNKTVTDWLIIGGPFDSAPLALDYMALIFLPFLISGARLETVLGRDGKWYVVNKNQPVA